MGIPCRHYFRPWINVQGLPFHISLIRPRWYQDPAFTTETIPVVCRTHELKPQEFKFETLTIQSGINTCRREVINSLADSRVNEESLDSGPNPKKSCSGRTYKWALCRNEEHNHSHCPNIEGFSEKPGFLIRIIHVAHTVFSRPLGLDLCGSSGPSTEGWWVADDMREIVLKIRTVSLSSYSGSSPTSADKIELPTTYLTFVSQGLNFGSSASASAFAFSVDPTEPVNIQAIPPCARTSCAVGEVSSRFDACPPISTPPAVPAGTQRLAPHSHVLSDSPAGVSTSNAGTRASNACIRAVPPASSHRTASKKITAHYIHFGVPTCTNAGMYGVRLLARRPARAGWKERKSVSERAGRMIMDEGRTCSAAREPTLATSKAYFPSLLFLARRGDEERKESTHKLHTEVHRRRGVRKGKRRRVAARRGESESESESEGAGTGTGRGERGGGEVGTCARVHRLGGIHSVDSGDGDRPSDIRSRIHGIRVRVAVHRIHRVHNIYSVNSGRLQHHTRRGGRGQVGEGPGGGRGRDGDVHQLHFHRVRSHIDDDFVGRVEDVDEPRGGVAGMRTRYGGGGGGRAGEGEQRLCIRVCVNAEAREDGAQALRTAPLPQVESQSQAEESRRNVCTPVAAAAEGRGIDITVQRDRVSGDEGHEEGEVNYKEEKGEFGEGGGRGLSGGRGAAARRPCG
ncbi:hypothetical protein DFH09DRAFT_1071585 [Mycena vulgaris]|nr:hypothetical protein DFH09DRAFT_1071585 [Mycena vulgaris]